ncbi:MAG: hypothetical protein ACRD34_09445 [Bryobacteraceae bacterium]
MALFRRFCLFCLPVVLFAAASQPWQSKQATDWNESDIHQILNDSPWARMVKPKIDKSAERYRGRHRRPMMNVGGFGIGMGRRGGMNGPSPRESGSNLPPPVLTVRWESAFPVQVAELKGHDVDAPTMDKKHYAIAVYGIPNRMIDLDASGLNNRLKTQAVIKRSGKREIKASKVEVIPRQDNTAVVYFFPRSKEITRQDKVKFHAQIGRLQISQSFQPQDMIYQGKLDL